MAAMTFDLPVGVEVEQGDRGVPGGTARPGASAGVTRSGSSCGDQIAGLHAGPVEVLDPLASPVRSVHPLEERRDHLAELVQHQFGVTTGLGKRMRSHPKKEHLVGLAGAVDAHVGKRGGRKQTAEGIEGLGPDRLAVDEVGVRPAGAGGGPSTRPVASSSSSP